MTEGLIASEKTNYKIGLNDTGDAKKFLGNILG